MINRSALENIGEKTTAGSFQALLMTLIWKKIAGMITGAASGIRTEKIVNAMQTCML
jgi:hypothetical protein